MTRQQKRFGERLRQYREAAGYSQEVLAERASLSANAISALERGERKRPYPDTLRRLAEALGLGTEERAELIAAASQARATEPTDTEATQARSPVQVMAALPGEPTPLIGREREADVVRHLLAQAEGRLLTLTGPGGVGKTRLALHVTRSVADHYSDGVAWVELVPLADPALVVPSIARALGLEETSSGDPRDAVRRWLQPRRTLLVLDNFEHVLDAAAEIASLLRACQGLHILATSRAPLSIRGEQEYNVPPLELPPASSMHERGDPSVVSSMQLFAWYARQKNPAFALTEENVDTVAAICRRLDGLPLALELAAARVRALSAAELLARLDHLLPLLVGGSRDVPQRQQTMRAAIDWSHELLNPAGRTLFRRLSVFAGGWTLEAAEAAASWGEIEADGIIDLLSQLVEQSLVVAEASHDGASRYKMLEPIRQFAAHKVEESGEGVELHDHHLAWCLGLAQQAEQELVGPGQQQWLDHLQQEHDNLRVALAWSPEEDHTRTSGLRLAADLWRFWATRGHLSEGRRWLESALATAVEAPPALRARALNAAGSLASDQGDYAQAITLHEASLELRRALGDAEGIARSLNDLANVRLNEGDYVRANASYGEALALFRHAGHDWGIALASHNMGICAGYLGQYDRASGLLDEALVSWKRLGDTAHQAKSLDALGVVMRARGDLSRAARLHEESLAIRRVLGDTRGIGVTLRNYGMVVRDMGDYAGAARLMEESLQVRRTIGDKAGVAGSLAALAETERRAGETERAEALYREAIGVRRQMGVTDGLADCLLGMAAIAHGRGEPARAARLLAASEALRKTSNVVMAQPDRAEYERTVAAIEASMTADDLTREREAGRAMPLEEIITQVASESAS